MTYQIISFLLSIAISFTIFYLLKKTNKIRHQPDDSKVFVLSIIVAVFFSWLTSLSSSTITSIKTETAIQLFVTLTLGYGSLVPNNAGSRHATLSGIIFSLYFILFEILKSIFN